MASFDSSVASGFAIEGQWISVQPFGTGHIHATYLAEYQSAGRVRRYIHQRINTHVFADPGSLMENIQRVTRHLRHRMEANGTDAIDRRTLTVVPTLDGHSHLQTRTGEIWRTFPYIEHTTTRETVATPEHACEAARAFGNFLRLLDDLPPPRLHETIPDFHNTRKRFIALQDAITRDARHRVSGSQPEIDYALGEEPIVDVLHGLGLPERITHNDTKITNVLFDRSTGEGICVIDLDTTMPGLAPHDFGDLVRTAACPAPEDETDLSRVRLHMPLFDALVRGYLEATGKLLTDAEIGRLAFSGRLIAYETGIRFLTDHLQGDTYFAIDRPGHNLDRARAQFALCASIKAQQAVMERSVERIHGSLW